MSSPFLSTGGPVGMCVNLCGTPGDPCAAGAGLPLSGLHCLRGVRPEERREPADLVRRVRHLLPYLLPPAPARLRAAGRLEVPVVGSVACPADEVDNVGNVLARTVGVFSFAVPGMRWTDFGLI